MKQGDGLRSWFSMAHLTVAARMFASYSLEFCIAAGVPLDLSYPGSLKYGSLTKMSDWMETNTWAKKSAILIPYLCNPIRCQ